MTPEQAHDLVDHFGGIRAAARAIGMTHSGLRYRLDPEYAERQRAARRALYDNLTGTEYSRELLRLRRTKALTRRRQRSTRT